MQMVSFQVMHDTPATGEGITVTVDGHVSNALPFTVGGSGTIRFVATTGSDSNAGTWSAPFATMQAATDAMGPGDITYVRDGVSQRTNCNVYNACVNVFNEGTADAPMALIAYPGATVTLGDGSVARALGNFNVGHGRASWHWVISKLTILDAGGLALPANTGWRLVGNFITMPHGDGSAGAIYVGGDHVKVLGNELTGLASQNPNASKLFHTIYASGERTGDPPRLPTESDREIAWNSLHDNQNNRGINIYSEQAYSALIQNHRVHDNVIINQRGVGILLGGYVTADNWVYNNVIDQAGLGPDWPAEGVSGHTCMQIDVGADTTPATATTLNVFNNTLSRCGYGPSEHPDSNNLGASGAISFGDIFARATVVFRNNLIFSEGNPYLSPWTSNVPPSSAYTNGWYGLASPPSWDTAAMTQDPKWVSLSDHDFRLTANSPAVDVGVDVAAQAARDLDGVPRPQGAKVDLGAFEFVVACTSEAQCLTPPACHLAVGAQCVVGTCVYQTDPACQAVDAGGSPSDAGSAPADGGVQRDAGSTPSDGGISRDGGILRDGGVADSGVPSVDAGLGTVPPDAGPERIDAGLGPVTPDAGTSSHRDGGSADGGDLSGDMVGGCGCQQGSAPGSLLTLAAVVAGLGLRRKARRSDG